MTAIEDGHVFDLGGRKVTCYYCPGHTPGSMVAIDSKTGCMFSGDAFSSKMALGISPCPGITHVSVEAALCALKRVDSFDFDRRMCFNSHSQNRELGGPMSADVLSNAILALENIVNGAAEIVHDYIPVIGREIDLYTFRNVSIQFHMYHLEKSWV